MLNPKKPYLNLEKEKENFFVLFNYFIKRAREVSKFHVTEPTIPHERKLKQEDARRRLRGMCGFQKELRVCWMEMEVE